MTGLAGRAFASLVSLFLAMAALLFGPPWTIDYWQAWVFLAVYFGGSTALIFYLLKKDPALLERRMRGGPLAEQRPSQKIIMLFASAGFIGALVMMAGIPIALGSGWGLLALAAMMPALVWRILDEEKFLAVNLPGYETYTQKVRYRLIPHVW